MNEELRARAGDLDEPAPELVTGPRVNERIAEALQSGESDEDLPMQRAHIEQMGARVIEVQFGQA